MLPINARLDVPLMADLVIVLLLFELGVLFETINESVLLKAMLLAFTLPVLPVAVRCLDVRMPIWGATLKISSLLAVLSSTEVVGLDLCGHKWCFVHA